MEYKKPSQKNEAGEVLYVSDTTTDGIGALELTMEVVIHYNGDEAKFKRIKDKMATEEMQRAYSPEFVSADSDDNDAWVVYKVTVENYEDNTRPANLDLEKFLDELQDDICEGDEPEEIPGH